MVNNPLYPGYAPRKKDEESINPLYPGYYTGKPIQRRPKSKEYLKPVEYDLDQIISGIDETGRKVLLSPLAGPRWVKDRIIDDWKGQLKASVGVDIKLTDMDDYSTEEFPGAQAAISLKPEDWGVVGKKKGGEQARKQLRKTLTEWAKQSTGINLDNPLKSNFSDIENKANRQLWMHALGYGISDETPEIEKRGGKAIAERTSAMFGKTTIPLNIKGVDGDKTYDDTANAAVEFAGNRDNANKRDSYHNSFLREALKATNKEIQNNYSEVGNKGSAKSAMDRHKGAINFFNTRVQAMENMYDFQKELSEQGKNLKKIRVAKKITDKESSIKDVWGNIEKKVNDSKQKTNDRKIEAERLFKSGEITKKSYEVFIQDIKKYEDYLDKVTGHVEKNKLLGKPNQDAERFLSGGSLGKQLIARDVFQESIVGNLQKHMEYDLISTGEKTLGSLITDRDVAAAGVDFRAKSIRPLAYRLRQDRIRYATKDLLKAWDDEKLLERYAWKALKQAAPERVSKVLSGDFIGEYLKNRNRLGLTVTDEGIKRLKESNPRKFEKFERKHAYKQSIKLDPEIFGGITRLVLHGGDHFKILSHNFLKNLDGSSDDKDLQLIKIGLKLGIEIKLPGKDDEKNGVPISAAYKLFRDQMSLKMHKVSYDTLLDKDKEKAVNEFLKNFESYNLAMLSSAKNLTLDQRLELLKRIREKNKKLNGGYKLDRKYILFLDKIHNKMLDIQKYWEKTVFGKSIKFLSNWKNIAGENISKYVSKAIAKLLGVTAGATGFLAVLMPIIEKTVEFMVKKTIAYTEAALSAIIKWDFEKLGAMFQKDMVKLMKSCLVIMIIVVTPTMALVLMFFGLVGTVVSPIDPTRTVAICTLDVDLESLPNAPMPPKVNTGSRIADVAFTIVSQLERAFWGYYNRPSASMSTQYSTYDGTHPIFNNQIFSALGEDACEETVRDVGDEWLILFWCTWLTRQAYMFGSGLPAEIVNQYLLPGAQSTMSAFIGGGNGFSYFANGSGTPKPGDVIFYSRGGSTATHVGIVYSVTQDYVTTVESNAGYRTVDLSRSGDTVGSIGGLTVLGFGTHSDD